MGTAVAAGNHFTAGFEGIRQQHRRTLDGVDVGVVIDKFRQGISRFVQFTANKVVVHEEPLVIVKSSAPQCTGSRKQREAFSAKQRAG